MSSHVGIRLCTLEISISSRFALLLLEVADDLAEAEHAHRDRHEADAVGQLGDAEAVARDARVDVGADDAAQQPDEDHARSP